MTQDLHRKQRIFIENFTLIEALNKLAGESNYQSKIFDLGKLNIRLSWQSGIATVFFLIGVLVYTSLKVFYKELKLGELMAILGIVSTLMPSIANLALLSIPIKKFLQLSIMLV